MKIASVNRELTLLKTMFNFARRENWVSKSPFDMGASLISVADETKRDRTISRDEEERLLLALSSSDRAHARSIVIAALDTGARQTELFTLTWCDVDLLSGVITIRAFNTKTMRSRQVPISDRLRDELQRIAESPLVSKETNGDLKDLGLVFDSSRFDRIWRAALRDAGVVGARFHDCRHSFASRLAHAGISVPELGALLGHTMYQTTLRYANPTEETMQKAAEMLNRMQDEGREADDATGYVN